MLKKSTKTSNAPIIVAFHMYRTFVAYGPCSCVMAADSRTSSGQSGETDEKRVRGITAHEAEAPTSALESYPAVEGLSCSHTTSCHP